MADISIGIGMNLRPGIGIWYQYRYEFWVSVSGIGIDMNLGYRYGSSAGYRWNTSIRQQYEGQSLEYMYLSVASVRGKIVLSSIPSFNVKTPT